MAKLTPEEKQKPAPIPMPDPLWPVGAAPEHLTPAQRGSAIAQAAYEGVDSWACKKCGSHLNRSTMKPDLCDACYKLEASNTKLAQLVNSNWMEQAEACGLALYERQPEETDIEWLIWTKYREHYPMKLPTWTALADECHVSVATVTKAAQRWSFRVRMQAWARATDDEMAEQRITAIKEMNKRQTEMAVTLQEKLQTAIAAIEPALLRPGEIVQLMKVATELERRIKLATPEKVEGTAQAAGQKQQTLTKPEDIGEVIGILAKTGMLPGQKIAVEQTTTTRIVAAGEEETGQPVVIVDGGVQDDTV